ncbi:MAG: Nif11-like leader peptide family natural product precursor [Planctomycetota bacterium]|nr:Nif11-like leader peptide family natural product precursor [Planctomycetota bacterium]
MSKQHVSDFRAAIAADPALAEQVREVMNAGGDPEALLALARARGFEFTAAEADEVLAESELSELELELVSGGGGTWGGDGRS